MNFKEIGERIKEKRTSRNMTQKQLSIIINKSESTIQKYENGMVEIPLVTLEYLAEILRTNIPYLLGFDVQTEENREEKKLDKFSIFKDQLELLGYNYLCFDSNSEDPNDRLNYRSAYNINEDFYVLISNDVKIKISKNEFENLRESFYSYMEFMLHRLVKKYQ